MEPIIETYRDADWAGDVNTKRSTSEKIFPLGKNPIQWITKGWCV